MNVETVDLAEKKSDHLHCSHGQVSEECQDKTQELVACKDQSLSDREIKKICSKKYHDAHKRLIGSSSAEWDSVPADPLRKEASDGINDSTIQGKK